MTAFTHVLHINHIPAIQGKTYLFNVESHKEQIVIDLLKELHSEFGVVKDRFLSKCVDLEKELRTLPKYCESNFLNFHKKESSAYENFIFAGKDAEDFKRKYPHYLRNYLLYEFWRLFAINYISASTFHSVKPIEVLGVELLEFLNAHYLDLDVEVYTIPYKIDFLSAKNYFLEHHSAIYFDMKELGVIDYLDTYFSEVTIDKKVYLKKNENILCY